MPDDAQTDGVIAEREPDYSYRLADEPSIMLSEGIAACQRGAEEVSGATHPTCGASLV
jgi:hypothetical protein